MSRNTQEEMDVKLKALVHLSKKINDARRAAIVFYLLIRRDINEKGIKLGFIPLISKIEKNTFDYMKAINIVMENNFQFHIFDDQMVSKVQKYELLYLRNPGSFPFDALKDLINLYYDLRKREVPNLHQSLLDMDIEGTSRALSAYKLLVRCNKGRSGVFSRKDKSDPAKHYLSIDLDHKENMVHKKLKQGYDKDSFEQLLQLRKMKRELKQDSSGKFFFKGALKDNVLYQQGFNEIPGFFLIGLAIVFMMLAIVLFIQDFMRPEIAGAFTLFAFALFGAALFIVFIYWKLFYQEVQKK